MIQGRIASGRGAMEQPNVTGDGGAERTPIFWVMIALTGVATGLFGDLLMWILFGIQHLAFDITPENCNPPSNMRPTFEECSRYRSPEFSGDSSGTCCVDI